MRKLLISILALSLGSVSCGTLEGWYGHDEDADHDDERTVSVEESTTMLEGENEMRHYGNVDRWSDLIEDEID